MTLSALFAAYMTVLELPTASDGLGIPAILGYPDLGRPLASSAVAALVLVSDSFSAGGQDGLNNLQNRRIGSTTTEIHAHLSIFAENERALLTAIDNLRNVKATQRTISDGSNSYAIRYGLTERGPFTGENRLLDHSITTEVVFSIRS